MNRDILPNSTIFIKKYSGSSIIVANKKDNMYMNRHSDVSERNPLLMFEIERIQT